MRRILSDEEIEQARRWRFEQGVSWRRIGRNLRCDFKTIRAALDPQFAAEYAARQKAEYARRFLASQADADQETETLQRITRARNVKADAAFQAAMLRAFELGQERIRCGIVRTPGTHAPRLQLGQRAPISPGQSPGAQCADG